MNGITAAEAIAAAKDSKGFVTTIAKRLNCSRVHVYNLMKKYPTFQQAVEDERETLKDFTEGALLTQIKEGNITAIIFYLKTQAKDRGYTEKYEVAASNINIDVSTLNDEQLQRIANGDDPLQVVAATKSES